MEKQGSMGAKPMTEPLFVCVYVPEMPAQALLRLRQTHALAAVAVLEGDAPLEQVCSVNTLATRMGVAHGMTRAELDTFDGLTVLRRSVPEERTACSILLETVGIFTPRVEVRPVKAHAFAMVLDMAGTARLFGPPMQMVSSIAEKLKELKFFVQMAASANLPAAVCMAPFARNVPVLLPAGEEARCLARLPLGALDLSAAQTDKLSLWGLKTLGEVAALPEVELVVRLGQEGKRLWRLACGAQEHLMVPEEGTFTLEERMAFDAPVEMMDSLLFVLGPMLDQLLLRAQNRALALASVTVKLALDGGGEHVRTIKPALPVMQRDVLLKLLHLDLQAHPPPAGVMSLLVHAEPGDRSKVQLGLFAPQLPESTRLDVTLARIAALVGEERVGSARLTDTHKSDGFVMDKFAVGDAKNTSNETPQHAVAIRRCRPPVSIRMNKEGARPDTFFLRGKRYAVKEAFGPWRKSGQWWSAEIWSREEWDVRGTANSGETLLCLLAHDLLRNCWQLEALYD